MRIPLMDLRFSSGGYWKLPWSSNHSLRLHTYGIQSPFFYNDQRDDLIFITLFHLI